MKIIIAPAKKMIIEEYMNASSMPMYLDKTKELQQTLLTFNKEELKKLWKVNDQILNDSYEHLHSYDIEKAYSPAIYSYSGIQYQYLSVNTLDQSSLDYLNDHLRILSGYYGILRPLDAIYPYRLEMCHKLSINNHKNLYDYWGDLLYKGLDDHLIINLSSDEYTSSIKPYLKDTDTLINIYFGEIINDSFKIKGTIAKMARGEMVRFMAINKIENIEEIKSFHELNFQYSKELSDTFNYYFIRGNKND